MLFIKEALIFEEFFSMILPHLCLLVIIVHHCCRVYVFICSQPSMSSKLLLLAIQCQTNGGKQEQFCASPDSVLGIPCVPGPWRCILSTFLPHIPQWKTNFCLVFVVSLVREGLSPVPMGMRPQMVLVWDPGLCTFSHYFNKVRIYQ